MSAELLAFLLSLGCGAAMLLLWDIFSGMRRVFAHGILINIVLDILWWLASASIFLWCMWFTVALELRFFEAFAVVVGALIYKLTVSRLIRRFFCVLFESILKIITFIFKILLTPAVFLYKILSVLYIRKEKR